VKEFFANAAEIIRAASSSPLGIVALAILTVATLAYLLFAKSTDDRKNAAFFATMGFVAFLVIGWALVTKPPTIASSSAPSPPSSINTGSYTRLRDLLAAGQWKEADDENAKVMLKVAGREKEGFLDENAMETFSCSALRDIDRLWVQASKGRFGYSVQNQIWKDLGGSPGAKVYTVEQKKNYQDSVGWIGHGEDGRAFSWRGWDYRTFNINAPKGHLPGWFSRLNRSSDFFPDGIYLADTCRL
jgi:hypothetical protein